MKVPLVSAHVCFSVLLCKHSLAACEDESHACLRLTLAIFSQVTCVWAKNQFRAGMFCAYGHHRLVVTDIDKGLVDEALYG